MTKINKTKTQLFEKINKTDKTSSENDQKERRHKLEISGLKRDIS